MHIPHQIILSHLAIYRFFPVLPAHVLSLLSTMSASCLDRTLISKSVAGTGVNVTLLVQALAPLCPKPTPPVDIAANHIVTIVIGYVCGFLPWGFIALFDFISAKWKTVRRTRRLGYFHLGASVVPMGFVIAYALLQALSGDYKEMMTAVIAVALTLHHVLRTVWGLVQLRHYVTWGRETLQCIKATLPKDWTRMWNCIDEDDNDESIDLDDALMVNEEIVDNEFTGRDVSVSYEFSSGAMRVSNPELCTIRWAAAFLCSLGHNWESEGSKPLPDELKFYITLSLFHMDESKSGSPPVSFEYLSKTIFSDGCNYGAYASTISERIMDSFNYPFNSFQFEFDGIVSSYPPCNESEERYLIEDNRNDARLELVEFILASRMLGPQKLVAIATESRHRHDAFLCHQQLQDAFDLLQHQLGTDEPVSVSRVHWFIKLAIVPCLIDKPYAFALQTSVQIDSDLALSFGRFLVEKNSVKILHEEYDVAFDSSKNLLQALDFPSSSSYMLGTLLDIVRKSLAQWVLRSGELNYATCWCPGLATDSISFVLSDYLTSKLKEDPSNFHDNSNFLSECQIAVQKVILSSSREKTQTPRSTEIIALFLLAYPALHIKHQGFTQDITDSSNTTVEFMIRPIIAPQSVFLSVKVKASLGTASLKITAENEEMKFKWEEWINAAMQLMKWYNQMAKTKIEKEGKGKFSGPLDLIKKTDLSRSMCTLKYSDQNDVLSRLPGTLHVWTAWPMFDVRFCRFELGQWMDAWDSLPNGWREADKEHRRRKIIAMETLTEIVGWDRA